MLLHRFDLSGRVAIVTGASSGIGARAAVVLAAAGATVIATARRQDRLDALAASQQGIVTVVGDVTNPQARIELVETALAHSDRLDVLVNNAGVGGSGTPADEALDCFRSVFATNVEAAFHLCQLARPHLAATGGAVVNVGSILGEVSGSPLSQASYAASKGALHSLTRELAVAWARDGVRVNTLAPGWIRTEMTADLQDDENASAWVVRHTPMRRMGEVDELDGALLFLASSASSFCTGQTLCIDGGWTAR